MVKGLYISATDNHVGKTMLAIGLLLKLREAGKTAGYFKPFARATSRDNIDEDAVVVKEILGTSAPEPSPFTVHLNMYFETIEALGAENVLTKIKEAYQKVAAGCDAVVVEGNRLVHQFYSFGLSDFDLAGKLDCEMVLINRPRSDANIDDLLVLCEIARNKGSKIVGVVFTDVSIDMVDRAKVLFTKKLNDAGVDVLGVVPKLPELEAPTVQEVFEAMGGEVLVRGPPERMEALVENFLIGAMNFASALTYLRRGVNKAVITGGDRADLLLAALDTSVSCLVLTGNLRPAPQIIASAREKGVPVILVPTDTFHTATRLKKIIPKIQVSEKEECLKVVDKYVDLGKLI
ncbi:MAG: phosphotransacetylase family protein [Promethearchaeota archaeon]